MKEYDVVVIGGGPGGYVAAIRGRQLGMKIALVEKNRLGGVCLNWGCIPTKSLLRNAEVIHLLGQGEEFGFSFDRQSLKISYAAAHKRSRRISDRLAGAVDHLMRKNEIDVYSGCGKIIGPTTVMVKPDGIKLNTKNIIVATGSRPQALQGVKFDGKKILDWNHALQLTRLPPKIVIVGAGAVGMEFAYLWRSYGVDITVVEMRPSVLPWADEDVSKELARNFKRQKIKLITGARVKAVKSSSKDVKLTVNCLGKNKELKAAKILVAAGIKPNSENLGLDEAGVIRNNGYLDIDDAMRTNVPHIFAIGDVTGKLPLAHVASAQGATAMEFIAGRKPRSLKYRNMPRCCYCHPEVASIGYTEKEAVAKGYELKVGRFLLSANGKAMGLGENKGFVKIIADKITDELLGIHLIGSQATELLGGLTGLVALEATTEELAHTVFPHPSLSEAIKEAAHATLGETLHL